MSIKEDLKKAQEEMGVTSDYFRFKQGENVIRLLTKGALMAAHFVGVGKASAVCYGVQNGCPYHKDENKKPSIRYVAYIHDVKGNKVELVEIPFSVISSIGDLQEDSDYSFDSYPMPYHVKVVYDENESPANKYKVVPSPKRIPPPADIVEKLAEALAKVTPEQYVEKRKNFWKEKGTTLEDVYPKDEIQLEDIGF